jgi:hypothetical protein
MFEVAASRRIAVDANQQIFKLFYVRRSPDRGIGCTGHRRCTSVGTSYFREGTGDIAARHAAAILR